MILAPMIVSIAAVCSVISLGLDDDYITLMLNSLHANRLFLDAPVTIFDNRHTHSPAIYPYSYTFPATCCTLLRSC